MTKADLIPNRKYLHRRRTEIMGITRTAERWLRCERITGTGAVFGRDFEAETVLTDEQIEKELIETWQR